MNLTVNTSEMQSNGSINMQSMLQKKRLEKEKKRKKGNKKK